MAAAPRRLLFGILLLLGVCVSQSGCVQRRMMVRSNPPGATVYVDDYEIGTTPIATNFTYYGTRRIRLVKDGYETLTVLQPIPPPWYEFWGVDFVTENLVPGEIRDYRTLSYQLAPQRVVPTDQLLERAEGFRRAQPAPSVPAIPMTPAVPGTAPPATVPGGAAPPATSPEPVPVPPPSGVGGYPVYPLPGR